MELGDALLAANITPAFRRKLADLRVVVREPGEKSTISVDDANEPSIGPIRLTEDREQSGQADRDRYHPKRLAILEYRGLDCSNPITTLAAAPNTCDDDRPGFDGAFLSRQCLRSATR